MEGGWYACAACHFFSPYWLKDNRVNLWRIQCSPSEGHMLAGKCLCKHCFSDGSAKRLQELIIHDFISLPEIHK